MSSLEFKLECQYCSIGRVGVLLIKLCQLITYTITFFFLIDSPLITSSNSSAAKWMPVSGL